MATHTYSLSWERHFRVDGDGNTCEGLCCHHLALLSALCRQSQQSLDAALLYNKTTVVLYGAYCIVQPAGGGR